MPADLREPDAADVTLVISDLHVGGGTNDPGDDHVDGGRPFVRFLDEQAATPQGDAGRMELVINGDFLEFAQTLQDAYSHPSDEFWCDEDESLAKVDAILEGHPDLFAALARFAQKNRVTIAAGNHDVDLCWPRVQQRLRDKVGGRLAFVIGASWITRYDGKLRIAHGHLDDPANRFLHWDEPIRDTGWGAKRLEMCPGTLFMVKFVNRLEEKYPFADNLLPVTQLARVLLHEEKLGFAAMAWWFLSFGATSPLGVLKSADDPYPERLVARLKADKVHRDAVAAALERGGAVALAMRVRSGPHTIKLLGEVAEALMGVLALDEMESLFGMSAATLGASGSPTLSAVARASGYDGRKALRNLAMKEFDTGAHVVVMGHTHQPDKMQVGGAMYYNPGSWTRYLELGKEARTTLADLKDESAYPYALQYVRVTRAGGGLDSEMVCFESDPGRFATAPSTTLTS